MHDCSSLSTHVRSDLQWNSIGFAGSKIILEALDFNKSLTKLNLSGNDIPLEILSVLGSKLQKNVTLQQSGRQIAQCNTLLNNQIKLLEESHHDKMIKMSSLLQKAEASRDITFEETADVMRQLHKSIKEKTDTISSLEARCRQNEKESKAATVELSTVKQKLISLQQDHEVEISKLKYHYEQQMQELEAKSLELNLGAKKAVTDKAEVILKLESTDKLLKQAEESIAQLNEDKLSLVKRNEELWEAKQKALSEERKKMEEIVSEQRDKDRHQVEMLRQESEALILALKNKVTLLEQEKTVHLEKLETHKVNCERLRADSMKQVRALQEELSLSRLQFDNELEEISLKHTRGIKEKEMECEKKDLLVKELEERLDRLNQTSKSLQKELGVLRLELDEKDCEARLAVERLRDEFKDCSEEILKLQNCKTKLEKDLVSVRHDLESCRNEKEFQMRVLNTKLEKMDELLLTKDALIQQMRTDEFQRANILHSAVISYVQSVPRHRPLQYGPQAHPDTPFLPRDVNGTDCDDAHNP